MAPTNKLPKRTPCQNVNRTSMSWQSHVRTAMGDPHVSSLLDEIEEHDRISCWLPTKNSSAGVVLQHCVQVIDDIHACHAPIIYKVGFTADPKLRWDNRRYGYKWAIEKWDRMVILFLSKEPWSISMLEASLIDRYFGALAALVCFLKALKNMLTNGMFDSFTC